MAAIKQSTFFTQRLLAFIQGSVFFMIIYMGIYLFRQDIVDSENQIHGTELESLRQEYDFIIIGGGSAGSVVANRLSENKYWTVLLIEAGGEEPVLSDLPILMRKLQKSPIDWQFYSEPTDKFCLSQGNHSFWPRGKVIGGTSVINGLIYCRGNSKDYDRWEKLGNKGWSYKNVLPYFKKSEDMKVPELQSSQYHGTGGYLSIDNFWYHSLISEALVASGQDIGYKVTKDINGESQAGFTLPQATLKDGLRCSTAKGFLRPVKDRKNLHITLNSFVTKIIIDKYRKVAEGVQFEKDGKTLTIKAKKEVILSAGSVQTPQILMLNGIGPEDHLREKGIEPILPLPGVGKNLQDHVAMGGITFLFESPPSTLPRGAGFIPPRILTPETLYEFLFQHKGPVYDQPFIEMTAFVNSKYNNDPTWPDIQLIASIASDNNEFGLTEESNIGVNEEAYEKVFAPILFKDAYNMAPLVMRPSSTGFIKLKDNNPHSYPLIYPNYFNNSRDLEILIDGAKLIYNLSLTPTMQKYKTKFYAVPLPGCESYTMLSDKFWECQARHYTRTIYHPCGTAKMGPASDPQAVVDPELLVHGLNNLRVIDGSVMPRIPTGNVNAPIIMVAEKGSDLIKYKWRNSG